MNVTQEQVVVLREEKQHILYGQDFHLGNGTGFKPITLALRGECNTHYLCHPYNTLKPA